MIKLSQRSKYVLKFNLLGTYQSVGGLRFTLSSAIRDTVQRCLSLAARPLTSVEGCRWVVSSSRSRRRRIRICRDTSEIRLRSSPVHVRHLQTRRTERHHWSPEWPMLTWVLLRECLWQLIPTAANVYVHHRTHQLYSLVTTTIVLSQCK